jgi:hypothetical protein
MFGRSPRRTPEAIVTQAIALIIALAGSDLKRSRAKQTQSTKNTELPGSHDIFLSHYLSHARIFHTPARWQLSRARGGSTDQLPV